MTQKYEGLAYQWVAQLKDGTEVSQFDENGENEVLFKDVKDKEIVNFLLEKVDTKKREFAVNLTNGQFTAFGRNIKAAEGAVIVSDGGPDDKPWKYRLIYFRSVTRHFTGSFEQTAMEIAFVIGWQSTVTSKEGKTRNVKKMMLVFDSDRIAFG